MIAARFPILEAAQANALLESGEVIGNAERSMLWFAPRKPGSGWSKPNKARVERMIAAGLMAPAGLARVAAAQSDGSWSVLDGVEALEIPPDLAQALAANPDAQRYWDAFPRSVKRGILEWIVNARRPETRTRRITETVTLAAENRRANQWQQRSMKTNEEEK